MINQQNLRPINRLNNPSRESASDRFNAELNREQMEQVRKELGIDSNPDPFDDDSSKGGLSSDPVSNPSQENDNSFNPVQFGRSVISTPTVQSSPKVLSPNKYFHLTKQMYNFALAKIKTDYRNNPVLSRVPWDPENNLVYGPNFYYYALINTLFRDQGISTASQGDIEDILNSGALDLTNSSSNSGLVLITLSDPNVYFAKQIAKDLSQVQGKNISGLKFPIYIPISEIDLVNDSASPTGLGFKVIKNAKVIYAPILNPDSRFSEYQDDEPMTSYNPVTYSVDYEESDIDPSSGLPTKVGVVNDPVLCRKLHVATEGLTMLDYEFGVYGKSDSVLSSTSFEFDEQSHYGKVICVKGGK